MNIENLSQQELLKYATILLERTNLEQSIRFLEVGFSREQLHSSRELAVKCVQLQNDVSKRMEEYRNSK